MVEIEEIAEFSGWLFFLLFLGSITWIITRTNRIYHYRYISKPSFCPSDGAWIAIWIVIYVFISLAAELVCINGGWDKNVITLGLLVLLMIIIHIWYIWIYILQYMLVAYVWIFIILLLAIITTVLFFIQNVWAGFILLLFTVFCLFWLVVSHGYYVLNGSVCHINYKVQCINECPCSRCVSLKKPCKEECSKIESNIDPVTQASLTGKYPIPDFLHL
jgi:translocator protein